MSNIPPNGQDNFFSTLWHFRGRIRRKTFWLGKLFFGSVAFLFLVNGEIIVYLLYQFLVRPVLEIPLCVKRWHDLNASGWFVLLNLIPCTDIFFVFVLGFSKGTFRSNRYGSDPLEPNKQSGKDNSCENN